MPTRVELSDERYVCLDPRSSEDPGTAKGLAPRSDTLEGGVIGLAVNGLQEGMMVALADEVARRTGASRVLKVLKQGLSVPPEPEDWERLIREADAVIAGYGG
ncbi:MAG: hypothetical protein JRF61_04620 [Deltaproteobacteria bacterium]|jgi:hypothetical protein|nr:hypothetical protein [Deltaproteobacteria bacterium]